MRAHVLALALLSGCVLLDARRNNKTMRTLVTLKGTLAGALPQGRPAFVVLFRAGAKGWTRQASRVLYAPGPFEFLTTPGEAQVFAFVDGDGNSVFDASEPSAAVEVPDQPAGATFDIGTLSPAAPGAQPRLAVDLNASGLSEELVKVHRGDLARFDEKRFTDEAGKLGFWQPVDFALKYGVGVSFLEAYDPARTPVLFVHGAEGTPATFEPLAKSIDRTRLQPWFYSYPSGIRLELAAATLKRIVDDLQLKLGFKSLIVVAHSMGGLVARAFVAMAAERGYVKLLVTISTPFGGHESAQTGVDHSPVVVPCWLDMAANSPFLLSLRKPLPAPVPHHLFFSYIGGSASSGPTDGTVSMRSMLVSEVEQSAARVLGFPETHDSILLSPDFQAAFNASLSTATP